MGAQPEMDTTYLQTLGQADKVEQWREICTEYLEQENDDD